LGKMIWNFWAKKYHGLRVQKYSLGPTREKVKHLITEICDGRDRCLLDIGCGIGELLCELEDIHHLRRFGMDFSPNMIQISLAKNSEVTHYVMDVHDLDKIERQFDLITCTHSLPYYSNQQKCIKMMQEILEKDGRAIIAFAMVNSWFDKLALQFVKLTTGPAIYLKDEDFKEMIHGLFKIESQEIIRLKPYMPTIMVYDLRKVDK